MLHSALHVHSVKKAKQKPTLPVTSRHFPSLPVNPAEARKLIESE
jgi:hypothetical protein